MIIIIRKLPPHPSRCFLVELYILEYKRSERAFLPSLNFLRKIQDPVNQKIAL